MNQNAAQNQTTTEKEPVSTRQALIKKLTSRKFLVSLAGTITGVMGMIGCSDDATKVVAFGVVSAVSILGYVIMEGKVDAAAVGNATATLNTLMKMISEMQNSQPQNATLYESGELCGTLSTSDLDPISRAIYDTANNSATTITITKSGITDSIEMEEINEDNTEERG